MSSAAPVHPATSLRALRPAFTLLEVLLALALIILLMTALTLFYANVMQARERGSKLAYDAIQMRAMLDRLVGELRQVVAIMPGDGKGFHGTSNSITILRSRLPDTSVYQLHSQFDTLPPAQTDLMRVTYRLWYDEDNRRDTQGYRLCHGIYRTEERTIDPNPKFIMANDNPQEQKDSQDQQSSQDQMNSEGQQGDQADIEFPQPEGELYAPEIKFLRFEYFDGMQWRDRWNVTASGAAGGDGASGAASSATGGATCVLPQAVRITMGRVPEPPEFEDMDVNQLKKQREEVEKREHHGDRFTVTVYLPQSDQSLLSTRKKGATDDRDEMGEQTSGGGS